MFDSGLDQLSAIPKTSVFFIDKIVSEFFLRKKNLYSSTQNEAFIQDDRKQDGTHYRPAETTMNYGTL